MEVIVSFQKAVIKDGRSGGITWRGEHIDEYVIMNICFPNLVKDILRSEKNRSKSHNIDAAYEAHIP